jgi:transcription initiation factor IIE alpha subunit
MANARYLADDVAAQLERYVWATDADERREALLAWMEKVTTALDVLLSRDESDG